LEVSRVYGLKDWLINAKCIGVFDFVFFHVKIYELPMSSDALRWKWD